MFTEQIESDEGFVEADLAKFEAVYSVNDDDKFNSDSEGFAELNYRVASLCFTYYGEDDNFASRINKAYIYLNKNHTASDAGDLGSYENENLAECYYQICSFYKKYILSKTADEASASDFQSLFDTLNNLLDSIESDTNANKYDKLVLYNGIFMLLYDRCGDMASVDLSQDTVLDLYDRVYESATNLQVGESKEYAKKLQDEMESKYASYREAIERKYNNTKERD